MKRNTLLTLCAITALGATTALGIVKAIPVEPASATTLACDTRTWNSTSSTDFSLDANWNPTNAPDTTSEKAVIPDLSGSLVVPIMTANETVGSLEIQNKGELQTGAYTLTIQAGGCDGIMRIANGGLLDIQAGGVVDLASVVTHDIGGELRLSTSTSDLKVSADVTLDVGGLAAAGSVNGRHNDAQIRIAANKTLTNLIEIRGNLTLMKDAATAGTFNNGSTGIVRADVAGTLRAQDVDLTGAGAWKAVMDGSAILEFATADTTGLSGDFTLSHDATLKFLANITTSGSFTANPRCGLVDVDTNANVCFKATGNAFELCDNETYDTGCPP